MNPSALMAALLLCVAAAAGGYWQGLRHGQTACTAAKLAPLQAAVAHHGVALAQGTLSDKKSAARITQTAAVFNGINAEVIDYVQTHPVTADSCTLDPVGLRLWAAANANTWFDSAAASIKHAAVPGPAAARERPAERSLDQSPGDRQGVPRVPGSAPGADRSPRSDQGAIKP